MNRIDKTFESCRNEDRKALVMFVSAGDPNLEVSERLIAEIAAAGADIIELGVPFSDPMADGPSIQAASQRALAAGTTLQGILDMVRRLRLRIDTPLVLFSYYNVLLQYGIEKLATASAEVGIDGWLVVDVPAEEAEEVRPHIEPHGLQWITLLAPTTPPRRQADLLAKASGFAYYITVTGVTGARDRLPENLVADLDAVRALSPVPVVAGFGISSPEMAKAVGAHADGIVVGSALINTLAEAYDPETGIAQCSEFVRSLATALR